MAPLRLPLPPAFSCFFPLSLLLFVVHLQAQQCFDVGNAKLKSDYASLNAFLNHTLANRTLVSNPCNWTAEVQCRCRNERIRRLTISGAGLVGEIPVGTLGKLTELQGLNLSHNLLEGKIPRDIWGLANLTSLDLSYNNFSGNLSISKSTAKSAVQLQELDLSENNFGGLFPSSLGELRGLRVLNLSGNDLQGAVANFSRLSRLNSLALSGNRLQGPFSASLPHNLAVLELRNNLLEDDVSQLPGACPFLQHLDLSFNPQLGNATFPSNLTALTGLEFLSLSNSSFAADAFPPIFNLLNLTYLGFSNLSLLSLVPTDLSLLTGLQTLDLSHNSLYGTIPPDLSSLPNLTSLDLSYNNLSGPIPPQYCRFFPAAFQFNVLLVLGSCQADMAPPSPAPPPLLPGEPQASPVLASMRSRQRLKAAAVVGIVMGGAGAALVVLALVGWRRRAARKANQPHLAAAGADVARAQRRHFPRQDSTSAEIDAGSWMAAVKDSSLVPVVLFEKPLVNFSLTDLLAATSCFSKELQISDGPSGPVYKAILANGLLVAIRVLSDRGNRSEMEAVQQLEKLGRVKHANVVPLLGYCVVGKARILLYEFILNGDLHGRLHDLPEGIANTEDWSMDTWEQLEGDGPGDSLGWETRHRIALGLARALAFLHHGCQPSIVHGAMKASNVLLHFDDEPYLADCGILGLMAAARDEEQDAAVGPSPSPSSSSRRRTGYAPPESAQSSKAGMSIKGDVYSFGVTLLELVTGRLPAGEDLYESCGGTLVTWVRSLIRENQGYRALDLKLTRKGPLPEMLEALRIGYLCTAESPSKRPSMHQVVLLLKDIQ